MQTYEERIYGRNLQGSQADLMAYYAVVDRVQLQILKDAALSVGLHCSSYSPQFSQSCAQYIQALEAATS